MSCHKCCNKIHLNNLYYEIFSLMHCEIFHEQNQMKFKYTQNHNNTLVCKGEKVRVKRIRKKVEWQKKNIL